MICLLFISEQAVPQNTQYVRLLPEQALFFYKYGHSFTAGMLSFSQIRRQQNTLSEKALQLNACIFHLRQINDTHAAKRK